MLYCLIYPRLITINVREYSISIKPPFKVSVHEINYGFSYLGTGFINDMALKILL